MANREIRRKQKIDNIVNEKRIGDNYDFISRYLFR